MVLPTKLSRQQLRDDPHLVWNTYVSILALSDSRELTPNQLDAQLVFFYENDVQNGGHLQFFENGDANRFQEVICASWAARSIVPCRRVAQGRRALDWESPPQNWNS